MLLGYLSSNAGQLLAGRRVPELTRWMARAGALTALALALSRWERTSTAVDAALCTASALMVLALAVALVTPFAPRIVRGSAAASAFAALLILVREASP